MNWEDWLPPKPLPKVKDHEFKIGQVWATSIPNHDNSIYVYRVINVNVTIVDVDMLANGKYIPSFAYTSLVDYHSRLIQDVDQTEPTDPDILYQDLFMPQK